MGIFSKNFVYFMVFMKVVYVLNFLVNLNILGYVLFNSLVWGSVLFLFMVFNLLLFVSVMLRVSVGESVGVE